MRAFLSYTKDMLLRGAAAVSGFLYGLGHAGRASAIMLLVLMAADYISGIAAAALGKSKHTAGGGLSGAAGAKGLWKKAMMLLVVVIAYALDWFANDGGAMFSTAAIWFYISNEALSLLENLALAGVPVPARLRRMLEGLKAQDDKTPPPDVTDEGQNG